MAMIPRPLGSTPSRTKLSIGNDAIPGKGTLAGLSRCFVLISLMDRVRTNATLFAEHSASIKRSRVALDTRVVSRFTVTQGRLFPLFRLLATFFLRVGARFRAVFFAPVPRTFPASSG